MSNPRAACAVMLTSQKVLVAVKVSYIPTTSPYLILLNSTFLMQVASATLSRLLPLQLAFERFQNISLS